MPLNVHSGFTKQQLSPEEEPVTLSVKTPKALPLSMMIRSRSSELLGILHLIPARLSRISLKSHFASGADCRITGNAEVTELLMGCLLPFIVTAADHPIRSAPGLVPINGHGILHPNRDAVDSRKRGAMPTYEDRRCK